MFAKRTLFFLFGFAFFLAPFHALMSLAEAADTNPITFEKIPDENDTNQWTYEKSRTTFYSDPDGTIIPAAIFHDYISADKEYTMVVGEIFGQKLFWLWETAHDTKGKVGFKGASGRAYIGDRSTFGLQEKYDQSGRIIGIFFYLIPDDMRGEITIFVPRK